MFRDNGLNIIELFYILALMQATNYNLRAKELLWHWRMKMKGYLAPFLLVFIIGFLPAGGQKQRSEVVNWSLGLQNTRTGELVPFSAPVPAATGEKYRLVIIPEAGCYCYVVYESPGGTDVAVLYEGSLTSKEIWYSVEMELRPPSGSESLFVIVSKEEQKVLAQTIAAYKNNSASVQRRALMSEIFRIRSEVSEFRESPDKPVFMGGAARGDPDKSQGVAFSGSPAYVKTISINH